MIKIPKEVRCNFVISLDREYQEVIYKEVTNELLNNGVSLIENIGRAMSSRVSDLEDTIEIQYI